MKRTSTVKLWLGALTCSLSFTTGLLADDADASYRDDHMSQGQILAWQSWTAPSVGAATEEDEFYESAAGNAYQFEYLPGFDVANDINNRGQILAQAGLDGYLIDDDVITPIAVPGAFGTQPTDINEHGEIVGFYALGDPSMGSPTFGFHRDRHGVYTTIAYPGALATFLWGLNEPGDVVGFFIPPNPPFLQTPFLLTRDGEFVLLEVPGAVAAVAYGINNQGTISGGYADNSFSIHGYLLDSDGTLVVDYPGAVQTFAGRINNKGACNGTYSNSNPNPEGADSSFLHNQQGVYSDFAVPGAAATLLRGINDRGDVCGFFIDPESPPQAFIAFRLNDDDSQGAGGDNSY